MSGIESRPSRNRSNLHLVESGQRYPTRPRRPFLQALWNNKENILAGISLLGFSMGGGLIGASVPMASEEVAEIGRKIFLASAANYATLGSFILTKRIVIKGLSTFQQWWEGDRYL